MNTIGQLQYQQITRELIESLQPTHAATLTLLPAYRTEAKAEWVCERFKHNLNKCIWGRNRYKNGLARLSFAACLQGSEKDDLHIHLAIGGFPERFTQEQLSDRFNKVAGHTHGIWEQTDFAVIRGQNGEWINYITLDVRKRYDQMFLIQQIDKQLIPTSPLS